MAKISGRPSSVDRLKADEALPESVYRSGTYSPFSDPVYFKEKLADPSHARAERGPVKNNPVALPGPDHWAGATGGAALHPAQIQLPPGHQKRPRLPLPAHPGGLNL